MSNRMSNIIVLVISFMNCLKEILAEGSFVFWNCSARLTSVQKSICELS